MRAAPELLARGASLAQEGKLDRAIDCLKACVEQNPDWPEALSNLGNALREAGRTTEAVCWLERALRLRPAFPEALVNLAILLEERGELEAARRKLSQALALRPGLALAYNNLGSVLAKMGSNREAVAAIMEALRLRPDFVEALHNLGVVLDGMGRTDEAIRQYREAIRRRPGFAEAHLDLGLALLSKGEFGPGFEEYEWRWRTRRVAPRRFRQPLWDGSPLEGRTLLVHAEQGLGDTIQFVRYLELFQSGDVILEVQPALTRLLDPLRRSVPALKHILPSEATLPEFDVHAPLLSLPRLFRTTPQTIPNRTPYLVMDDGERLREFRTRTSSARLRVGIVWAGGAQNSRNSSRSMRTSDLEPLAGARGVEFFTLQKGLAALEATPGSLLLKELIADTEDVLDTAAAILNLDLVVSVDTLVAHLAGALGRPVWTLLSHAPDWRWLRDRQDSQWYPTMRLFRQSRPGNWRNVVEGVRTELEHLCQRQLQ